MPLIPCRECQQTVADTAKACPHCGAPVRMTFMKGLSNATGALARLADEKIEKAAEAARRNDTPEARRWRRIQGAAALGFLALLVVGYLALRIYFAFFEH